MYVFPNQRDQNYLNKLKEIFSIDNIIKTAIPLKTPKSYDHDNNKIIYEKCVRIDFVGISALLLHDSRTLPSDNPKDLAEVQQIFEDIFEKTQYINSNKIFISFRFLLLYPYCAHAQSRIQAEASKNRATISEDRYSRNWTFVEPVTENIFIKSSLVQTQNALLSFLYDKAIRYGYSETSLNRLLIRFVPMAANVCMLCVNDDIFSVSYLLSKFKRTDKRLISRSPIIHVNKDEHKTTFDCYVDHFRYLWELPQTIDAADAVNVDSYTKDYESIKSPLEITFQEKAKRILEKENRQNDNNSGNEKTIRISRWKLRTKYLLRQHCPIIPKSVPDCEHIFIACSWDREIEKVNNYALQLQELLTHDFQSYNIKILIVDGQGGDSLKKVVYESLNTTSVGLILLTRDIESKDGKFYSRPNIYQELGYLMGKLEGDNKIFARVIPIIEDGVSPASNFSDKIGHIFSQEDGIILIYHRVLNDLMTIFEFDKHTKKKFFEIHHGRLSLKLNEKQNNQKLIKAMKDVKSFIG